MSSFSSRARWTFALVVAFMGGLLFASGMSWTRLGFAAPKTVTGGSAADHGRQQCFRRNR